MSSLERRVGKIRPPNTQIFPGGAKPSLSEAKSLLSLWGKGKNMRNVTHNARYHFVEHGLPKGADVWQYLRDAAAFQKNPNRVAIPRGPTDIKYEFHTSTHVEYSLERNGKIIFYGKDKKNK